VTVSDVLDVHDNLFSRAINRRAARCAEQQERATYPRAERVEKEHACATTSVVVLAIWERNYRAQC